MSACDGRRLRFMRKASSAVACAGWPFAAPGALDDHFLTVFTPAGSVGRDDTEHQPADAGNGP